MPLIWPIVNLMSLKLNCKYLLVAFLVILIGILSRKVNSIPFFIGDILYAIMIYSIVHFLIYCNSKIIKFTIPLSICFIIELSQLIDSNWLNTLRHTTLGRYTLGEGFLWSDLLCYTFGIILAYIIDLKLAKIQNSESW